MEKNYSYKFDFETLKNDFKNIIEKFNENLSKKNLIKVQNVYILNLIKPYNIYIYI